MCATRFVDQVIATCEDAMPSAKEMQGLAKTVETYRNSSSEAKALQDIRELRT